MSLISIKNGSNSDKGWNRVERGGTESEPLHPSRFLCVPTHPPPPLNQRKNTVEAKERLKRRFSKGWNKNRDEPKNRRGQTGKNSFGKGW